MALTPAPLALWGESPKWTPGSPPGIGHDQQHGFPHTVWVREELFNLEMCVELLLQNYPESPQKPSGSEIYCGEKLNKTLGKKSRLKILRKSWKRVTFCLSRIDYEISYPSELKGWQCVQLGQKNIDLACRNPAIQSPHQGRNISEIKIIFALLFLYK